jgi:hypothetical protein
VFTELPEMLFLGNSVSGTAHSRKLREPEDMKRAGAVRDPGAKTTAYRLVRLLWASQNSVKASEALPDKHYKGHGGKKGPGCSNAAFSLALALLAAPPLPSSVVSEIWQLPATLLGLGLANAGAAIATTIAAITNATVNTKIMRFILHYLLLPGDPQWTAATFALHLDHGSNREKAHWPKDQFSDG